MQIESKLPLLIFQTCLKVLSEAKNFQILATPNISISFPVMDETQLQPIIQTDAPHIMFARFNCMTNNLVHNVLRIS